MPDATPTATVNLVEDPSAFDWDAFMAARQRPQRTIKLYPRDLTLDAALDDLDERAARLEEIAARTENVEAGDRGINDPSPEVLRAQAEQLVTEREQLRERWEATAVPFTVQELMPDEIRAAIALAKEDGVADVDERACYAVAAAIVSPPTTGPQLIALSKTDRSGLAMVNELIAFSRESWEAPSSPFSRRSSSAPS